jgi:hypothetical protein
MDIDQWTFYTFVFIENELVHPSKVRLVAMKKKSLVKMTTELS